jgi:hypothetical protein
MATMVVTPDSNLFTCSDLAGSAIRGQNMHWELLTTQAVFCVRAGSFVQVRWCWCNYYYYCCAVVRCHS